MPRAPVIGYFQPTFLFESSSSSSSPGSLLVLDRRLALRRGQVFALYVAGYPVGRIVVELLRSDQANHILGLRVNVWTSILVFLLGVYLFRRVGRRAGGVRRDGGRAPRPGCGRAEPVAPE